LNRRNFIVDFLFWVLAFFFGYMIKEEGNNVNLTKTDPDKDGNNISDKVLELSTQLSEITHSLKSLGGRGIDEDSTFDNSTILQNAINSLPAGSVILLSKKFRINKGIVITRPVQIIGNGIDTGLSLYGSGSAITLGYSNFSSTIENVKLKNFSLDGSNSPGGQDHLGVAVYRGLYNEIDIKISNFNKSSNSKGIMIKGGYATNNSYFAATNLIYPRVGQCSTGIFLDDCVQNTIIIGGVVDGNPNDKANYAYGININDEKSQGNLILGTDVEDYHVGIRLNGTQNQLLRPRIENCTTKLLQDTSGGQNAIVMEWGIDNESEIVNKGGQLKVSGLGYDQLSQIVKVLSPSSTIAAELDIIGGSESNANISFFMGKNRVFQIANVPNGNEILFSAQNNGGTLTPMFGLRNTSYYPLAFLKGGMTFDDAMTTEEMPNNTLYRDKSTGKLVYKDNSGIVNPLY
jgi:hypothetical protein